MVKRNKRRAVHKAVHGPPEDKGVKPVQDPELPEEEKPPAAEETDPPAEESEQAPAAEPEPPSKPPRAKKCPHCTAELFPHDPDGPKAGCAHCNSCGCCFGPDGKPRPGHPVCSLATE